MLTPVTKLAPAREEAALLAPGEPPEWGWFLWLQNRYIDHGDLILPEWWQTSILDFLRARRTIWYVAAGLRSIKSGATTQLLISELLFRPRRAKLGQPFVCPIMAAGKAEAGGRVLTIRHIFREILGWTERERKGKGESDIVAAGEYLYSYTPHTGDGIFIFRDADDNLIHINTKVAALSGVREYTGAGGLCDEWDHVPLIAEGGGAHEILDYAIARLSGQAGAHLYVVSNPTHEKACLSAACAAGDGIDSYVARLGEWGAHRDEQQRDLLRLHLLATGEIDLAKDERLIEPADPRSWRLPTWVLNPTIDILECWTKTSDSADRKGDPDRLGTLFRIYGARSKGAEGASAIDRLALQRCLVPTEEVPAHVAAWMAGKGSPGMLERWFALDPAGSSNAFTAACIGLDISSNLWWILAIWSERPTLGKPLDVARVVVPLMAERCVMMGCSAWTSDAAEQNAVQNNDKGIRTAFQGGRLPEIWGHLKTVVDQGRLRATGPHAAEALRQAGLITKSRTPAGADTLYIPSEGTDHCDEAAALARAFYAAKAGNAPRPRRSYEGHPVASGAMGSSLADRLSAK